MKEARALDIKLCIPSLKFIEYDPKTKEVSGILGGPVRGIVRALKSTFKNVTFIKPDDGAKMITNKDVKELPGCWGKLQRGEADVYLYPHEMPVIGLENITQLNSSARQSGTYMLAPYSMNESRSEVVLGPLDSLNSVSVDTWVNAWVMFILFSVLMLYIKMFVYKRPTSDDSSSHLRQDPREEDEALHGQSILYQVITHMMQFETCDYTGDTIRYVSLLMTVFAFLFITLISCMITCDKVSTHDIQVYDTYEKILANKSVQPIWVENLNDYASYKRAPKGSKQAELWQQSMAISRGNPERPTLIETSVPSIMKKVHSARSKDMVVFLSNMFTKLFIGLICTGLSTENEGLKSLQDLRLKGRLDDRVSTSLYVLPLSRHSSIGKQADYTIRRILEAHLLYQPDFEHMIEVHITKEFLGGKINYNEDYYECLNFEKLPAGESETSPLALINTGDVFRWWMYGCFASFVLLLLEHVHHRSLGGQIMGRSRRRRTIIPQHGASSR